jgi:hypothetical protein
MYTRIGAGGANSRGGASSAGVSRSGASGMNGVSVKGESSGGANVTIARKVMTGIATSIIIGRSANGKCAGLTSPLPLNLIAKPAAAVS